MYYKVFLRFNILQFRCKNCPSLGPFWQQLADNLDSSSNIAVAKVDCSVETALCRGNKFIQFQIKYTFTQLRVRLHSYILQNKI